MNDESAGQGPPASLTRATDEFRRLVDELQYLINRSRRRPWRLPLICLASAGSATDADGGDPVDEVRRLLDCDGRQVPHAALDEADDLTTFVSQAYEELSKRRFAVKPLRFHHYRLLRRIMAIDLSDVDVEKRERVLARRLIFNPDGWIERNPWLTKMPDRLQRFLGFLAAFLAVFPAPAWQLANWRRANWLMHQPFARPAKSGNFPSFAVRLTAGQRHRENATEIRLLLVNAFLQDLRRAYSQLRGPRRTAYPVILINDVPSGSAAEIFLRAVNEIRNKVGGDPLLVVAGIRRSESREALPADLSTARTIALEHFPRDLATWQQNVDDSGRSLRGPAWYLLVDIPPRRPTPPPCLRPRRPSRLAHPLTATTLSVLLAAAVALISVPIMKERVAAAQAGCDAGLAQEDQVSLADGQCIGFSETGRVLFGTSKTVQALQSKIFEENGVAHDHWADRRNRPIITLVYLTSFTRPDGDRPDQETFIAEREGLKGMLYAQQRANLEADSSPTSPYVQVLVANAGDEAAYADEVVTMIIERAKSDKQIVAIVAAVDSRTKPVAALHRLGDAGLPVITPTMSADGIDAGASLFLQVAAPVTVEATLVHHYVTRILKLGNLINYYTHGKHEQRSDKSDLYVESLRTALAHSFGEKHYRDYFWSSGSSLSSACRKDAVIFFGGRYSQLADFIGRIHKDCSGKMPAVVADGSAARYMANLRERATAPQNMALAFISSGYLGTCAVIRESALPAVKRHSERQNYLQDIGSECGNEFAGQAAGWSALTYDSTRMIIRAMQDNAQLFTAGGTKGEWQPGTVQPQTLYAQMRRWTVRHPYEGVTGPISFDDEHGGVAANRYLAILCATSVQRAYRGKGDLPKLVDAVGSAYTTDSTAPGKPCAPA